MPPADLFPKAATDQVGHLDEERAAVATKSRFELAGEGTEAVADEVVVVAKIKSSTWVWCVAKKKLTPRV